MSLPAMVPRQTASAWRMPGCGPRCQIIVATFPGRRYPERLPVHDPDHHEAHGQHVLAPEAAGIFLRTVTRTGGLVVDTVTATVSVDGSPVAVTPTELGILVYLAEHLGVVCTPTEVLRAVWGESHAPRPARILGGRLHYPDLHLTRVHLTRLRTKLGTARRLVKTRPGVGYVLLNEEPT